MSEKTGGYEPVKIKSYKVKPRPAITSESLKKHKNNDGGMLQRLSAAKTIPIVPVRSLEAAGSVNEPVDPKQAVYGEDDVIADKWSTPLIVYFFSAFAALLREPRKAAFQLVTDKSSGTGFALMLLRIIFSIPFFYVFDKKAVELWETLSSGFPVGISGYTLNLFIPLISAEVTVIIINIFLMKILVSLFGGQIFFREIFIIKGSSAPARCLVLLLGTAFCYSDPLLGAVIGLLTGSIIGTVIEWFVFPRCSTLRSSRLVPSYYFIIASTTVICQFVVMILSSIR